MANRSTLTRAEPRTVDEARRAVEQSRARMSDTLDAIEGRLVAKKQEFADRMDVMRTVKQRVRSRPWPAIAIAFGVGVLLWKLRAGRDEHPEEAPQGRVAPVAAPRMSRAPSPSDKRSQVDTENSTFPVRQSR